MIRLKQLHKHFGANKVLQGLDLNFEQPGITAVLGPNGSGKTTLIKCMLGMVIPQEGSIHFEGQNIKGAHAYRDHISYLPQIARFPENLEVQELLRMLKDFRTRPANDEALIRRFKLEPFLDKRLGKLSGGTRQKVNLVLAFMYDNPLIILDEPTAGLDPVALIELKELIEEERSKGKVILITTHIMSFVEEIADEVVFLLEGVVHFRGSVDKLKTTYGEPSIERAIAKILEPEAALPNADQQTNQRLRRKETSVKPK